ncbi:MAG: phage integrase SAM-like domain-containing protein [Bacteroidales bacterium]|nr:phage integrase SAM-like domain-containing protein [Bacteroidales bacterium]
MRHTLTVLVHARQSKVDKNGMVPVYLRLTLNGSRIEISTFRKIDPDNWDEIACCMKGDSEEARIFNNHLSNLKAEVYKQYYILESQDKEITAESLKNSVLGVSERKHTLIEIFNYHNDQFKQRVGTDYVIATYKRYIVTLGKIKAFLDYQYRKSDILLEDLKHQFVTNFELYLKQKTIVDTTPQPSTSKT